MARATPTTGSRAPTTSRPTSWNRWWRRSDRCGDGRRRRSARAGGNCHCRRCCSSACHNQPRPGHPRPRGCGVLCTSLRRPSACAGLRCRRRHGSFGAAARGLGGNSHCQPRKRGEHAPVQFGLPRGTVATVSMRGSVWVGDWKDSTTGAQTTPESPGRKANALVDTGWSRLRCKGVRLRLPS